MKCNCSSNCNMFIARVSTKDF
uniref:Uncharacterized protein n=1 Tax=Rhizophora mucronata TaxID=61149 RepID=A0A2P2J2L5_RHIMU